MAVYSAIVAVESIKLSSPSKCDLPNRIVLNALPSWRAILSNSINDLVRTGRNAMFEMGLRLSAIIRGHAVQYVLRGYDERTVAIIVPAHTHTVYIYSDESVAHFFRCIFLAKRCPSPTEYRV